MKTMGKIFAGVCAIVFILTGVLALILFTLEWKVFSADTYKQVLREEGSYEDTPALIVTFLTTSAQAGSGSEPLFLKVLGKDGLESVLRTLIPSEQLEALTDSILESAFAYINGDSNSITISLVPIKQNLTGEAGVRAFMQIMSASPACTPEQVLQFALGSISTEEGLLFCNPPEEVMLLVAPLIESQIQTLTSSIPDEISLPVGTQSGSRQFIERLDRIRTMMQLSLFIPIAFLFLILIFAVRNMNDLLMWWGIPLVVTGGLSTFFALVGTPLIRFLLDFLLSQGTSELPAVLLGLMPDLAGSLARQILQPLAIEGIVLAAIGIGMLVMLKIRSRAALVPEIANG